MIVGEGRAKDLYRRLVWGPGRELLEGMPAPYEARLLRWMGGAAGRAMVGKRELLLGNLRLALPERGEAELGRIADAAFCSHFANQYASFSFEKCDVDTWPRYLRFEGLRHLEEARARGRGVVLMHPHMGPAQLPLHVLGRLGWPMHQIGGGRITLVDLSEEGRRSAALRSSLERRMPVTLHDGRGYLRPALRALQEGAVVMTACDGTGGGEELGRRLVREVLGQPMPLPVGPAWMASRTGAALLTLCCHRSPPFEEALYTAKIGPPLPLPADRRAALAAGADHTAAFLNEVLRRWPGDWLFWDGFTRGGLLSPLTEPPAS